MYELLRTQLLKVVKIEPHGAYLADGDGEKSEERVLLPAKEVPAGTGAGDLLSVFIYLDSEDRPIATTAAPKVAYHKAARLKVKDVTRIGAFLDWGLSKDLLLPFAEQTRRVAKGEEVLAALYLDKSSRPAATMKLYPYLSKNAPYRAGDEVEGTVYQDAPNFGVFVAVDDKYSGRISRAEAPKAYPIGSKVKLTVSEVLEDGKLALTARKKAWEMIDADAESVFSIICEDYGGELPFDDKAAPEKIREEFGLSKAAFKRAVGHLYKERMVEIADGRIKAVRADK